METTSDRPAGSDRGAHARILRYVAVEGPIGVGKTTLAQFLAEALGGRAVLEQVDGNDFLPLFYKDRERFAFQTQVSFLLSRYRQQAEIAAAGAEPVVSDYLLVKDRIFAGINLSGAELLLYERLWQVLEPRVPVPDVLVLLTATVDVLMQRIEGRGRPYERTFDRAYLTKVAEVYARDFAPEAFRDRHRSTPWGRCPLLVVDTAKLDLVASEADRAELLAAIREHQQGICIFEPHF